jgi:hypothetical protein
MPLFSSKYKTYTRTKVIRVPEELADTIMDLTYELDKYRDRTKEASNVTTVEKLMYNVIDKIKELKNTDVQR